MVCSSPGIRGPHPTAVALAALSVLALALRRCTAPTTTATPTSPGEKALARTAK